MQVERLTDAALPLIRGFRGNILQNPVLVDAIDFASQTPILQGFFNNVGNFSGDLAPVIRAYTVSRRLWHMHGLVLICRLSPSGCTVPFC